MAERTIDVDGVSLHVVDEGEGPAVLLVHGMGLDHRMWEAQATALVAAGFRAIRYDMRGHGRSGVPPRGYTLAHAQREALHLLDALAVERAHLAGLSMGGSIVANLSVRSPERVLTVTVLSSMASAYPGTSEFVLKGGTAQLLSGAADELEAYRKARLESFLFAETLTDPVVGPPLKTILLEALRTTAVLREIAEERAEGWCSPTDWDLWSSGSRNAPGLVVAGSSDDPTFTGFARDSARIPRTQSYVVDGARHMCNMSHPDHVNRELFALLGA